MKGTGRDRTGSEARKRQGREGMELATGRGRSEKDGKGLTWRQGEAEVERSGRDGTGSEVRQEEAEEEE